MIFRPRVCITHAQFYRSPGNSHRRGFIRVNMRYLLVLIDGLADTPLPELGGKTPLEAANSPALDKLAARGRLGTIRTVPRGQPPETLAALFTILGYPPGPYLTGRGYYEALSAGLMLGEEEWCFRLQFVTSVDGKMADPRAGGLSEEEGRELLRALESHFKQTRMRFVQGRGHNHLLIVDGTDFNGLTSVSPFNILDLPLKEHLPEGPGAEILHKVMNEAPGVLAKHEVNRVRVDLKQNPANAVWIWGGGAAVDVPGFQKTFGIEAAMVSYSDLFRGVAVATGIRVINPGESPFVHDASGRMTAVAPDDALIKATEIDEISRTRVSAEQALDGNQLVIAHFSAPDEHSHLGDAKGKVRAIELLDKHFFKPLAKRLETTKDVRLTVVPTLMCRVESRQHDERPVPFMMYGEGVESRWQLTLTESNAEETGIKIDDGTRLIDYIINGL
jgi:2,3-bisphosphoglycerate-independent phosphoglycerate mutase